MRKQRTKMIKPAHHDHEKVLHSRIHGVQPTDVGMVQFLQHGTSIANVGSSGKREFGGIESIENV